LTPRGYVFALDTTLDITQFAHQVWKIRDGFTEGYTESIAQTPDGYLWLGTEFGLIRFDGIRHVLWSPSTGQHLPSSNIRALLAARDGSLWIGTDSGLARWNNRKLTEYRELAGYNVFTLLEDHEGTIWAGGNSLPTGRICAIRQLDIRCDGQDGSLGTGPVSIYEDSQGSLWVGVAAGMWRWKPQPSMLYRVPGQDPVVEALLEGAQGEMILGTNGGIRRFAEGAFEPQSSSDRNLGVIRRLMRDKDGGVWIGTSNGLMHVHQGRTDSYAQSDGLTGNVVTSLYEDREGSIWVATLDGLEQFRNLTIPTITQAQGLRGTPSTVLDGGDGSIWVGTFNSGLNRLKDGQVTNYHVGSRPVVNGAVQEEHDAVVGRSREVVDEALGDDRASTLARDGQGRIWAAGGHTLSFFEKDRFVPVTKLQGGYSYAMTSDKAGSIWISHTSQGLIHLIGQRIVEQIAWSRFGSRGYALSLLSDPQSGGVWLGFLNGGVAFYENNRIRAVYDRSNGLGNGNVSSLYLDKQGALWAATEGGLSRLKNGDVATLTDKEGLPCPTVHWVIQDDLRSFWLGTSCGALRIDEQELDGWASGRIRSIHPTIFGNSDGVRSNAVMGGASPHVTKSPDGRLWFRVVDGISIIDPRHLPSNKLPPPVHIEQVTADRKTYDASSDLNGSLRLPSLIRDLEIGYTALSLVAPDRNSFRYKLEGYDRDWQNVGSRRQAFYTNLVPGNYRFRVVASNNSGVWNEQGAAVDFSIAPAYWQTTWFRTGCAAIVLLLVWALYQLRLRQIARVFNVRLEERVAERTRIARDLHDTLLQNFQGLLLRFQTVLALCETRPADAKEVLRSSIDQTAQAITEGREAVQGLRASTVERNDLARAITTLAEEIAAEASNHASVELRVGVEGTPRTLHPIVRDEIYRIGSEALRNAFRHAEAKQIEVELRYDERQLRLRIRDDGKGIDPAFLIGEGRAGHFGLHGIRERAKLIRGKLTVWTAPGSGTEIELSVPAVHAYAAFSAPWRSWFTEKFFGSARTSGHERPSQSDSDSVD